MLLGVSRPVRAGGQVWRLLMFFVGGMRGGWGMGGHMGTGLGWGFAARGSDPALWHSGVMNPNRQAKDQGPSGNDRGSSGGRSKDRWDTARTIPLPPCCYSCYILLPELLGRWWHGPFWERRCERRKEDTSDTSDMSDTSDTSAAAERCNGRMHK